MLFESAAFVSLCPFRRFPLFCVLPLIEGLTIFPCACLLSVCFYYFLLLFTISFSNSTYWFCFLFLFFPPSPLFVMWLAAPVHRVSDNYAVFTLAVEALPLSISVCDSNAWLWVYAVRTLQISKEVHASRLTKSLCTAFSVTMRKRPCFWSVPRMRGVEVS